jgi:hypothetical protein
MTKRLNHVSTESVNLNELTWLERVWLEVADEIVFETKHPQDQPCCQSCGHLRSLCRCTDPLRRRW